MKYKNKILIGSPIHQKPLILKEFLQSLKELSTEENEIHYLFIDDNTNLESKKILKNFAKDINNVNIISTDNLQQYITTDLTHFWNDQLIWKVAGYKNRIIKYALENHFDYLFLIDSDLILHPKTVQQLLLSNRDIISNIFWTKWQPNAIEMPQVWLQDEYSLIRKQESKHLTELETQQKVNQFIDKLKIPGVYEVGGLGACTLISKNALKSGVNFSEISNLSFWGEDRHFCIRAAALGFNLYVDTHYPALHLYRESDLQKIPSFKKQLSTVSENEENVFIRKSKDNKLTLSMIVRNEADNYLRQVLEKHKQYIDSAVIIDDGSTDDTVKIIKEILHDIPLHLIENSSSKFSNEVELRKQQWQETIKTKPDWILNLDADEMFEERFHSEVRSLINQDDFDLVSFRLFDFWDDQHYREDQYWNAHRYYRPFLLRYHEGFDYQWTDQPQHCGRFPNNIYQLPNTISPLRLKHYGWANSLKRKFKFSRYLMLDPEFKYGWKEQILSILDDNPNLVKWEE